MRMDEISFWTGVSDTLLDLEQYSEFVGKSSVLEGLLANARGMSVTHWCTFGERTEGLCTVHTQVGGVFEGIVVP